MARYFFLFIFLRLCFNKQREVSRLTHAILLYTRRRRDRRGRSFELQYYLLTDAVYFGSSVLDIYGAEIRMLGPDRTPAGSRSVRGVTPFGPRIMEILNRLVENMVTPDALPAALQQMLEQQKRGKGLDSQSPV